MGSGSGAKVGQVRGLTGWLLARLARGRQRSAPRLALVERITLAPRQSLALVEAEGRHILVATSAEGASAFYPLDESARTTVRKTTQNGAKSSAGRASKSVAANAARVSW